MKSYPEEYYANPILTLIPGNLGIHRQHQRPLWSLQIQRIEMHCRVRDTTDRL